MCQSETKRDEQLTRTPPSPRNPPHRATKPLHFQLDGCQPPASTLGGKVESGAAGGRALAAGPWPAEKLGGRRRRAAGGAPGTPQPRNSGGEPGEPHRAALRSPAQPHRRKPRRKLRGQLYRDGLDQPQPSHRSRPATRPVGAPTAADPQDWSQVGPVIKIGRENYSSKKRKHTSTFSIKLSRIFKN